VVVCGVPTDFFRSLLCINAEDFESIILENIFLENIRARAHFVILLTPSALERCIEPGDRLRPRD
jgi:hypothetical protein